MLRTLRTFVGAKLLPSTLLILRRLSIDVRRDSSLYWLGVREVLYQPDDLTYPAHGELIAEGGCLALAAAHTRQALQFFSNPGAASLLAPTCKHVEGVCRNLRLGCNTDKDVGAFIQYTLWACR